MHFELKSISVQSVPEALAKVERYRLLNEPTLAESICLDILAIVPDHQQALISLLLSRTDQFPSQLPAKAAQEVLARIKGDYEKAYYAGIICERRAKAQLNQGHPGSGHDAYELLREAMAWFEKSETLRPAKNDDPLLHWNTCARLIMGNQLTPRAEENIELSLE